MPLRFLYPAADVPIVEISQPLRRNPEDGLRMGAALSRLRDEDVLLLGTGGIVHNLSIARSRGAARAGRGLGARLRLLVRRAPRGDGRRGHRVVSDRRRPHAERAVPTPEHFDPVFVVLGSARSGERPTTIYEGFRYGTLSMRSFALA